MLPKFDDIAKSDVIGKTDDRNEKNNYTAEVLLKIAILSDQIMPPNLTLALDKTVDNASKIWRYHYHQNWRYRQYWRCCSFIDDSYTVIYYNDIIMGVMASQITSLMIAYSTHYSGADQRKHQSSASLAFVRGIHQWPVNSPPPPHKGPVTSNVENVSIWWRGPVTWKMVPFDDVIICLPLTHNPVDEISNARSHHQKYDWWH